MVTIMILQILSNGNSKSKDNALQFQDKDGSKILISVVRFVSFIFLD
jgi:hypothetical protein